MLGFGKKKTSITRQQALDARPVPAVKVELTETPDGGAKVKVPLRTRNWGGKFFRMPEGATKTFELDSIGLFVWRNCDGKTTVQQIIRRLAKEHSLSLREVEVSTVQFLQTLVRKGLIGMSVEEKKDK